MNITIIADASFCHETGAAGYGWWIASARGKIGGHGEMKTTPTNNTAAEMMALLNGLLAGLKKGIIQKGDIVLMQTDCQAAIDRFLQIRCKAETEQELILVAKLLEYEKRAEIETQFRHVKGHTQDPDPRYHVNRACDKQARMHMRKARDLLTVIDNGAP